MGHKKSKLKLLLFLEKEKQIHNQEIDTANINVPQNNEKTKQTKTK